jgi:hypothetical protein
VPRAEDVSRHSEVSEQKIFEIFVFLSLLFTYKFEFFRSLLDV